MTAIGREAAPGPLYGIANEVRSALAIEVAESLRAGSVDAA